MSFPTYVLSGVLRSEGWPQRGGFLGRRPIVESRVLDSAIDVLMRLAVCCGAEDRRLSARLLTQLYAARDWQTDGPDELFKALLKEALPALGSSRPWTVLGPPPTTPTSGRPRNVGWSFLAGPQFELVLVLTFARCLVWALSNQEAARAALDDERSRSLATLPDAVAHGLVITPDGLDANNADLLTVIVAFVEDFEREREPLPSPAPALARHPWFA